MRPALVAAVVACAALVAIPASPARAATTTTALVSPGAPARLLTFTATGDVHRLQFQGIRDQVVTITATGGTFAGNCGATLQLRNPSGGTVGPSVCVGQAGTRGPVTLGTRGLFVAEVRSANGAGSVSVAITQSGSIRSVTPNAPSITVNVPGDGTVDLGFGAAAGRYVGTTTFVTSGCAVTVAVIAPEARTLMPAECVGRLVGPQTTTVAGLYTVRLVNSGPEAIGVGVQLLAGEDIVRTTTVDAAPVEATLAPLQRLIVSFPATRGQSIDVRYPTQALRCVELRRPDDVLVRRDCGFNANFTIPDTKLGVGGTWKVIVRHKNPFPLSTSVQIVSVPDPTITTIDGPAKLIAFSSPGETSRLEFNATAGQKLVVGFSISVFLCFLGVECGCQDGGACLLQLELVDPTGAVAPENQFTFDLRSSAPVDPYLRRTVSMTGLWTIRVTSPRVGALGVQLVDAPDLASTVALDVPIRISDVKPAQRVVLSFPVTAGRTYGFAMTDNEGRAVVDTEVRRPDGTTVADTLAGVSDFGGPVTMTTSGTARITLVAEGLVPLDATLRIVDLAPIVTPVTLGTVSPFVSTYPTQVVRFTFEGAKNQRITTKIPVLSFNYPHAAGVRLRFGTRTLGTTRTIGGGIDFLDPVVLDATGTWTVEVDPAGDDAGALRLLLASVVDLTDTLVVDGPALSFELIQPGQRARFAVTRAAGSPMRVRVSNSGFFGSPVRILRPDGTVLQTCTLVHAAQDCPLVTAPVTGRYVVEFDPPGDVLDHATVSVRST